MITFLIPKGKIFTRLLSWASINVLLAKLSLATDRIISARMVAAQCV